MQEPNLLQIRFCGQPMAELAYREERGHGSYALAFDPDFLKAGHDLSPMNLPLERLGVPSLWSAGDTPFPGGLPGLIADSLPDAWGERMLAQEMPGLKTIPGKLAAIGPRGLGALSFEPVLGKGALDKGVPASLPTLAREAAALLQQPAQLDHGQVTAALAKGGSTLGGAFPKISTHLPRTGDILKLPEVLVGGPTPAGYRPSILKLTRTRNEAEGAVEYAYWLMAKAAGIRVPRACLVDDGERLHFAVERFDRILNPAGQWERLHVHSLSGLLHKRAADLAIDYEELLRLSRVLGGATEAEECFRRVVFNLLATVRDDHGRNHALLYDPRNRTWTLTPAFDLNPAVYNRLIALSFLQWAELPTDFADLARFAAIGGMDRKRAREIYQQVETAVIGGWSAAAKKARVPSGIAAYWGHEIDAQTRALRRNAAVSPRRRD